MAADGTSLAPLLLVSMPQMADPNFVRTVILLAEYGPDGAFGIVVNRRMDDPAHEVVQVEPPLDIRIDVHLFVGGPVAPGRAWSLC
jgi:putative transcriptional regulator